MTDMMEMLNELPEFFTQLKVKLSLQEQRIKELEEQVEANDRIEERMIAIQTKERVKFEEEKMKWIEEYKSLTILNETLLETNKGLLADNEKLISSTQQLEKSLDEQQRTIEVQSKKLQKKDYNKKYQEEHKEKVAKQKKEKTPSKKAYLQKAELLTCPCLANTKKTTFRRDGKSNHLKSKVHQTWYLNNPDWKEPTDWNGRNSTLHSKTEDEIEKLYEIERSKSPIR